MNFQESTTILNACKKKSGNLLNAPYIYIYIYIERERERVLFGPVKTDLRVIPSGQKNHSTVNI